MLLGNDFKPVVSKSKSGKFFKLVQEGECRWIRRMMCNCLTGGVSAYQHRAVGMMDHVITHGPHDCTTDLAQTTRPHHDQTHPLDLGRLLDKVAGTVVKVRDQDLSGNLQHKNMQMTREKNNTI